MLTEKLCHKTHQQQDPPILDPPWAAKAVQRTILPKEKALYHNIICAWIWVNCIYTSPTWVLASWVIIQNNRNITVIRTAEGYAEDNPLQIYTDGSKTKKGVGSGIAIYEYGQNIRTLQFKLNKECTNNQAEQLAILKALEALNNTQTVDKKLLYTLTARQPYLCYKTAKYTQT